MNIQEFSHQMAREDHPLSPSQLFRALRRLRVQDMGFLGDWKRINGNWGVWQEPCAHAGQPEPS